MEYFESLKTRFCTSENHTSEGLSEREIRRLLLHHRSLPLERFPTAVEEYLRLFGKKTGDFGDGGFGEFDTFISFKLEMMYQLLELGMPFLERTDFVFYNNQDYAFAYVDLASTEEDPYVNLLIAPNEGDKLLVNYCRFSEFVMQHQS